MTTTIISYFSTTYGRLIRHFKTVGHMTGKAHIKNGSTDTTTYYNIYYFRNQYTGLPSKGRTWFKDNTQMRITSTQIFQQLNKMLHVIIFTRHQMTTSQIQPLDLRKPAREFFFQMF
mgnify:CR=1 FL=1